MNKKILCKFGFHKTKQVMIVFAEDSMAWHLVCIRCDECLRIGTIDRNGNLEELE